MISGHCIATRLRRWRHFQFRPVVIKNILRILCGILPRTCNQCARLVITPARSIAMTALPYLYALTSYLRTSLAHFKTDVAMYHIIWTNQGTLHVLCALQYVGSQGRTGPRAQQ